MTKKNNELEEYLLSPEHVIRIIDKMVIVVPIKGESNKILFSPNEVSAKIVEYLGQKMSIDSMIKEIVASYNIESDFVKKDINIFLTQLKEFGALIEKSTSEFELDSNA